MSPRKKPRTQAQSLRRYLQSRRDALRQLSGDARCAPFSKNDHATNLVITVDWSEVHAYIFSGAAPENDAFRLPFADENLAEPAHQAALTVLFERLPLQLVLLQPYVGEMQSFLRQVQNKRDIVSFSNHYLRSLDKIKNDSEVMGRFADFVAEWKARPENKDKTLDSDDIDKYLSATDQDVVRRWISQEFGDLLLLARVSNQNVLANLKFLLRGSAEVKAKLVTLANNFPELAQVLTSVPDRVSAWDERLEEIIQRKAQVARHRDAKALDHLDRLNGQLHSAGFQLLFATRGADLKKVIAGQAAHFACLSEPYFSNNVPVPVPTIARDWHYFFELGLVMAGDANKMEENIMQRLNSVETTLEWLQPGGHSWEEVAKACERELRSDMRNLETFASTSKVRTSVSRASGDEEKLLGYFVKLVTSPGSFEATRRDILKEIDESLEQVAETLPFQFQPRARGRFGTSGYKPLAYALIEKLPNQLLLPHSGKRVAKIRRSLKALLNFVREPNAYSPEDVFAQVETQRHLDLHSDGNSAALHALAIYACDTPKRLYHTLERVGEPGTQPLSPAWLLLNLMKADVYVSVQRSPDKANAFLREQWEHARDLTDASETQEIRAVAFLNCILLLNLDWASTVSLEQGYGLDVQREVEDLNYLLSELDRISNESSMERMQKKCPRLRRAVLNNCLYARSILAWDLHMQGGDSDTHGTAERDEAAGHLNGSCTVIAASLGRGRREPSILDTLGLYFTVRAHLEQRRSVRNRWLGKADAYLREAQAFVPKYESSRLERSINDHLRFLRKVKSGLFLEDFRVA